MKVIHLSDLHLGKNVLEQSMIDDQKYILKQIVGIIINRNVDVVLIVGDVYDKAVPSIEAISLFNDFLSELNSLGRKVFIISGNHDSKDRLSFLNELLVDSNIYIEGIFRGSVRKVSMVDDYGCFNIYMLPFLKPSDIRPYFLNHSISSYQDAFFCLINELDINKEERNLIMVHQFVTANGVNVDRCEEEFFSLGGLDSIDVSLFDDFDYVAMGHVHRAQRLLKDTVRYCGSPLKYSFSEVNYKKSVPIIEFKDKGCVDIELVELNPIRDMRVIRGNISQLLKKEFYQLENVDDYVSIILEDNDYVIDAIDKLRKVYKNVLRVDYDNIRNGISDYNKLDNEINIQEKNELDLFSLFYQIQNNIEIDEFRKKIVKGIIEELKEDN